MWGGDECLSGSRTDMVVLTYAPYHLARATSCATGESPCTLAERGSHHCSTAMTRFQLSIFLAGLVLRTVAPEADVVVCGGTATGAAAAVPTARMARTVLLVAPETHVDGIAVDGLEEAMSTITCFATTSRWEATRASST